MHSHPRVLQFCAGHSDGATKLVQILRAAIAASKRKPQEATVIIALDIKNTFNTISRAHVLNTFASPSLNQFADLFPYIKTYYEKPSTLRFYAKGDYDDILSQTGVHQGDPSSFQLFSLRLHRILAKIANSIPNCFSFAYADNCYFCSAAFPSFCFTERFQRRNVSHWTVPQFV